MQTSMKDRSEGIVHVCESEIVCVRQWCVRVRVRERERVGILAAFSTVGTAAVRVNSQRAVLCGLRHLHDVRRLHVRAIPVAGASSSTTSRSNVRIFLLVASSHDLPTCLTHAVAPHGPQGCQGMPSPTVGPVSVGAMHLHLELLTHDDLVGKDVTRGNQGRAQDQLKQIVVSHLPISNIRDPTTASVDADTGGRAGENEVACPYTFTHLLGIRTTALFLSRAQLEKLW